MVLLCCMLKIAEMSGGMGGGGGDAGVAATAASVVRQKRRYRQRRRFRGKGGMNDVGLGRGLAHSPDSDCNSNHPGSGSVLSNTSSQDIDFIQDNSDYQWFIDFSYRDNHHTSILSLPESYDAGDIANYEALAKNMDANLAEADIESFRTEDIHALLTNLPPMCSEQLSQESHRQGESFASVSGSMMGKFDFDSSSPHSSSQDDSANSTSMSICKSELLFSPVKETPMPGANFSVDSLDCEYNDHDIMLTCQANKDNYTIAFEGSMTMYSEDSDYHFADKSDTSGGGSTHWAELKHPLRHLKTQDVSMTQSDTGFTTWSKLKKRCCENQLRRHPSGNNNQSVDAQHGFSDAGFKSQSMPNLYKQKLRSSITAQYQQYEQQRQQRSQHLSNSSVECCTIKRRPVKVFDIQHQVHSSSGNSMSDMATSIDASSSAECKAPNFNLVKLFMKQKSISAEGMSTGLDHSSSQSDNWPASQSDESNISNANHAPGPPKECFEDSLLMDQRPPEPLRTYESILEEEESRTDATDAIDGSMLSNNNGSMEYEKRLRSRSTSTNGNPRRNNSISSSGGSGSFTKSAKLKVPIHLMNKSIQTSQFETKSAPYKLNTTTAHSKEPYRVVEPSFLNKLKQEGEVHKPVYILYPNYVLPDLDFLEKEEVAKVFLMPHKMQKPAPKSRPFSCNDLETLKRKGFNHVQDWDSLNFLLPAECKQILSDVPEIAHHLRTHGARPEKPSFAKLKRASRPVSCDCTGYERAGSAERTNISSSSSTGTGPSSGYRGSSSQLSESQNSPAPQNNFNPLFVYRYDSVTSSEASLMGSEKRSITTTAPSTAPPLPKRGISLPETKEVAPPRPPLPRGILRKGIENKLKAGQTKRYSMFEMNEDDILNEVQNKRHSLQDAYLPRHKRLSETEDEGVDAGTSSSSLDEPTAFRSQSPLIKHDVLFQNISTEELVQLEEFLKMSGISTSDSDDINEESMLQLRSYVSKFLSLKINQDPNRKCVSFAEKVNVLPKAVPNNSPNVSALLQQRHQHGKALVDMPICEEGESTPEMSNSPARKNSKASLIQGVSDAVEKVIQHFSAATNQTELNQLGDSQVNPQCAKAALNYLCPALYAVLSDGLKPNLETSFGAIGNSVWQVVEASAQQGPLTKALNELVMRINGEDVITEGVVKFNAFVFGLLNVRSLDAWFSYMRTRESVLKKHYEADSLLLMSHTGGASIRQLLDSLITSLQPLALFPFQFDLLFEYRQLHESLKRMDSYHQPTSPVHKSWKQNSSESDELSTATAIRKYSFDGNSTDPSVPDLLNNSANHRSRSDKPRPRSCIDPGLLSAKPTFKLGEDVNSALKKRWSGINFSSKLYAAYNRLGSLAAENSEDEYTDSLEQNGGQAADEVTLPLDGPESLDSNISDDKPLNGRKFKKLQRRWEMLSTKEVSPPESPTHTPKSKIPRPVISPIKPSGIPVPVSPTYKGIKGVAKKVTSPNGAAAVKSKPFAQAKINTNLVTRSPAKKGINPRTSRLDQVETTEARNITRPSSLPYKPATAVGKNSKITPPRRAVSTSVNRKSAQSHTPKVVRTLSHRLPSESGHLSYNEGEKLKVVLEVDEKWLLCCRGTQKGLVPKAAVIAADTGRF